MNTKQKIATLAIAFIGLFLMPQATHASEGVAELRSLTGKPYRCVAESHQSLDRKYRVLVTCRDLLYPATSEVFSYVMWANPLQGGKIIKMGQLEFGRKLFVVNQPFTSVFVTAEPKPKVSKPAGPVVMQGTVHPREFLNTPSTSTPSPSQDQGTTNPSVTEATEEVQSNEQSGTLSKGLRRASLILAIILLAGAGTALFVVLQSKKR